MMCTTIRLISLNMVRLSKIVQLYLITTTTLYFFFFGTNFVVVFIRHQTNRSVHALARTTLSHASHNTFDVIPSCIANNALIKWQQIVLGSMQFRVFYTTLFHEDKVIGDSINRYFHGHIASYFRLG